MNKYLPSKKFTLIFLSIIIALGIIYFVSFYNGSKAREINLSDTANKIAVQDFMILDTDGDGLKDWEENLWKTDYKNPDTDGDGSSDGEEILSNRDPLKANTAKANEEPNDKIDPQVIINNKKTLDDFNKLSTTDRVGRILLSEYLATKKIGRDVTESDVAYIIDNALSTIPKLVFRQYTTGDLMVFETNEPTKIEEYGKKTVDTIHKYTVSTVPNFEQIIRSIEEEDTDEQIQVKLNNLKPLAESYQLLAFELLKINTPVIFANKHLLLINALMLMSENISQIITAANDPILMISLINTYPDSLNNLNTVVNNFSVL